MNIVFSSQITAIDEHNIGKTTIFLFIYTICRIPIYISIHFHNEFWFTLYEIDELF